MPKMRLGWYAGVSIALVGELGGSYMELWLIIMNQC